MKPFQIHEGILLALDRSNIDTDAIIPKQFLKSISRVGFGEQLFFDWRYLPDGSLNPEFPLNFPAFKGASILVAGNNFGCGSSREHAVWAIKQCGFEVLIAPFKDQNGSRIPGFADIFRNNSSKNGLLLIELTPDEVASIVAEIHKQPGLKAIVDLQKQSITLLTSSTKKLMYSFEIDPALKEKLLKGLDDIGITLQYESAITAYEQRHP